MVALQIRDVPDDVRQVLADTAAAGGQSLQSFLLTLVTAEARRASNLTLLAGLSARQDGSHLSSRQATAALDQARAERQALMSEARDSTR